VAMTCSICPHEQRDEIDKALVSGRSLRDMAGQFRVSKSALDRHRDHVKATLVKAAVRRETSRGATLLDRIHGLEDHARRLAMVCESEGDYRAALVGLQQIRETLRLLLDVRAAEIKDRRAASVELLQSPDWQRIKNILTATLLPYPEAQNALAHALRAELSSQKFGDDHAEEPPS